MPGMVCAYIHTYVSVCMCSITIISEKKRAGETVGTVGTVGGWHKRAKEKTLCYGFWRSGGRGKDNTKNNSIFKFYSTQLIQKTSAHEKNHRGNE